MLTAAVGAFKRDCSHSTSCNQVLLGTVKQTSQKNYDLDLFLSLSLSFQGAPQTSFKAGAHQGASLHSSPSSYSPSSTSAVETTALKFSFAFWFKNTESQLCKLLHAPRPPPGNLCWRRTGNLTGLRQDVEVFILADKKGHDPQAADLALSSAQRLGNARCRAVKPIVQLQAPGWRVKAPGGKQKLKQDVKLFSGEFWSGVSPVVPCQAPAHPSPTSLDPAGVTRAWQRGKGGIKCLFARGRRDSQRWAKIRVWAFPAHITSSSGLTSCKGCTVHSDGINKLRKAQPVPTQAVWAPVALHRACKRSR